MQIRHYLAQRREHIRHHIGVGVFVDRHPGRGMWHKNLTQAVLHIA